MPPEPDVTVVIPTRDRWPLVRRAVRSALDQRGVAVEVVVVDDGSSPEGDPGVADDRVRLERHPTSRGVASARNRGIELAVGTWVAFLDDDDLWAPDKLALQLAAAREADAGWAWAAATVVDEQLAPLRFMRSPSPEAVAGSLLRTNPVPALSGVAARADVLRRTGGFDPAFSAMADWDLWIRIGTTTPGAGVGRSVVAYVEHTSNMLAGAADPNDVRPEFERLAAKHANAAAAAGVPFGDVWWSRWVASHHRFAGRRGEASRAYLRGAVERRSPGDAVRAAGALVGGPAWSRLRSAVVREPEPPAWLERHRGS